MDRNRCSRCSETGVHDGPKRAVNYYDERKKDMVVRNAIKRLEQLGYKVAVQPVA